MIRPLLVLALLPFVACRGGDLSSLESDNLALQTEVDELTSRLEAVELALAETQAAQQASDADLAALAVDVEDLDAEVDAQVGLDLPQLLDEVSTNVDRLDALEAAGLATEEWVQTQGYASDVDAQAALDGVASNQLAIGELDGALGLAATARQELSDALVAEATARTELEGTTASLAADLLQTQSSVSSLDAQASTLATAAADLATEQSSLREDLDETTGMVADLETTVGGMASDLTSVQAGVSQNEVGLASVDGRVASLQLALSAQADTLAAVGIQAEELALQLGGVVSTTSGLRTDLDGLDALVGELQTQDDLFEGELLTLSDELSTVAADASLALSATSTLENDLLDVQSAVGTLQSDQDFLLDELSNLDGAVTDVGGQAEDNTGRIDTVENDLLDTLTDLDALQMDLSALGDEVSDNAAAPRTIHRVVGQGNDGRDNGFLTGRVLTFNKVSEDSELRVSWQDVRRCVGYCYGYWEAYVDGERCVDPAPMQWWNHAYAGNGGWRNNNHLPATITGYCSATAAGPIGAGEHTITIRVTHQGGESSDWYVGWDNSPFVIEAEEVL